jgi:HNH endonuclease
MTILGYKHDPRFIECERAFLVTGKGNVEKDRFNRDLLAKNESGYWKLKTERVAVGDLLFVLLPSPSIKGGYPRDLYAGIIDREPKRGQTGEVLLTVKRFYFLDSVLEKISKYLSDKNPPQGDTIMSVWSASNIDEEDESEYAEGKKAYRTHRISERDSGIVRRTKADRLKKTGKLDCEVCNFNFLSRYGVLGEKFIEAHHKKPVSLSDGETKTKSSDLALVCSNCHRMLHRSKPLLTPVELRNKLNKV